MPTITRTKVTMHAKPLKAGAGGADKAPPLTRRAAMRLEARDIILPTVPSSIINELSEYNILIHGEKKIGKTTLATAEEGVLLVTFDPLQKSRALLQMHMPDWPTVVKTIAALEAAAKSKEGYPYRRVVLDGVEIMHRLCQIFVEDEVVKVNHVSEGSYGKGWDAFNMEFAAAIDRFMGLPGGCWFICHSAWKEVETRQVGRKIQKLLPNIKRGAEEQIVGKVDGWFAYDYYEQERILIVRGDERTGAGHRISGHFFTPDKRPVYEIPMGANEYEAWSNFVKAFNNEQTFTRISEIRPKRIVPVQAAPTRRPGMAVPATAQRGGNGVGPMMRPTMLRR